MKIAFNSGVFQHSSLTDAIGVISRSGFDGIEIMADRPHALPAEMSAALLSELQETLKTRRVTVCALDSMTSRRAGDILSPSWIEEDWEPREQRIRYTLDCVRMAAALGIPYVITQGGGAVPASMNRREGWRLFVANMFRVLPLAKRLGVTLLIAPRPGTLIETSTHLTDLLKELHTEFECAKVYFDAGAFYCSGEEPCEAWEILGSQVGMIRLADMPENRVYSPKPLGEGVLNIDSLLSCVRETAFDGYVSVLHDAKERSAEDTLAISVEYLHKMGFLEKETP